MEDSNMATPTIKYPYLPTGRTILYAPANNRWMQEAKEFARIHSLDDHQKTGAVIVKNDEIIGRGVNGSDYHRTHECERVKRGTPTGQGYELCEGCHPKNHAEPSAIRDAVHLGHDTSGADMYLWGHWWACEPCWNAINEAHIANLYLLEGSEWLFNREHSDNIVGRQFV